MSLLWFEHLLIVSKPIVKRSLVVLSVKIPTPLPRYRFLIEMKEKKNTLELIITEKGSRDEENYA